MTQDPKTQPTLTEERIIQECVRESQSKSSIQSEGETIMRLKHPMLKKSATLLAALLVTGGGFLTFTPESGKAEGTRIVFVRQNGPYVANLCIKNVSKNNIETCTGQVGAGATRALTVPYDEGDKIIFIDAVRWGHNSFYGPLADRDTHCWSDGESLRPKTYCRMPSEAPF